MTASFQIRRDSAEAWTTANPILRAGEMAYENDSFSMKIGDGVNNWTNLPYFIAGNLAPPNSLWIGTQIEYDAFLEEEINLGRIYRIEDGLGTFVRYYIGDQQVATGGSGDVNKVGTPVDDQVGVWTGNGTIEGATGLTYNGALLNITGSVALSGTVDGRDLQIDGAKLDGIEASADVTNPTNVAGAGALMASQNLSDIADAATARSNLGVGTGSGDLLASNNLSDVADAATARTNIGAGVGDVTKSGGALANYIAIWDGDNKLKGSVHCRFDGTRFNVGYFGVPRDKIHTDGGIINGASHPYQSNIYFKDNWKCTTNGWGGYHYLSDSVGDTVLATLAVANTGGEQALATPIIRYRYDLSENEWLFYTNDTEALRLTSDQVTQVQGAAAATRSLGSNTTLAASDSGKMLRCTAAITLDGTANLVAGSRTTVIAAGGDVTVDGPGATNATISNGDIGVIIDDGTDTFVMSGAATVVS